MISEDHYGLLGETFVNFFVDALILYTACQLVHENNPLWNIDCHACTWRGEAGGDVHPLRVATYKQRSPMNLDEFFMKEVARSAPTSSWIYRFFGPVFATLKVVFFHKGGTSPRWDTPIALSYTSCYYANRKRIFKHVCSIAFSFFFFLLSINSQQLARRRILHEVCNVSKNST